MTREEAVEVLIDHANATTMIWDSLQEENYCNECGWNSARDRKPGEINVGHKDDCKLVAALKALDSYRE